MNKIGERIKEARNKAKLTQEQLGERLGITKSAISQWENGNTLPEMPLFIRFCENTKASADYILLGKVSDNYSQEVIGLAKRISQLDSKKRELLVAIFAT